MIHLLTLIGALALFLYGMQLYSSGAQKLFADKMTLSLAKTEDKPFKQLFSAFNYTAALQSSRAMTVILVSMVNAGMLSLRAAAGLIFGANVGTTITAWLIMILCFSIDPQVFAYPLLCIAFIFLLRKKDISRYLSDLLMGLALVLLAIFYMKGVILSLGSQNQVIATLLQWENYSYFSVLIFCLIGIVLSAILRSSAICLALCLIFLNNAFIPFSLAAAVVIGANIGTTITANIVAYKANYQARRAALIHLLFNGIAALVLLLCYPLFLALFNEVFALFGYPGTVEQTFNAPNIILYALCAVHTLFNLIPALILIFFSEYIVKLTKLAIKAENHKNDNLCFIDPSLVNSPSISIAHCYREIIHFGQITYQAFGLVQKAVNEKKSEKFEVIRKELVDYETLTDNMEAEIAQYLSKITASQLNEHESEEIKMLYRLISELESLGDSCENISRVLNRERLHNTYFDEDTIKKINLMLSKLDKAFQIMMENIKHASLSPLKSIASAYEIEEEINKCRDELRDCSMKDIDSHIDNRYQSFNYFLDIISELEAMGDFIINISQALYKSKLKEA